MKKLDNYSLHELEYKELVSTDGGNGGYQAGIPGYADAVAPIGSFFVGVFEGITGIHIF